MPYFLSLLRCLVRFLGCMVTFIVGDIYTKELEAVDHLHFSTTDTDWGMYSFLLPEVDGQLLSIADVEGCWLDIRLLNSLSFLYSVQSLLWPSWPQWSNCSGGCLSPVLTNCGLRVRKSTFQLQYSVLSVMSSIWNVLDHYTSSW